MCGFTVYTGSDQMTRLRIASEFQKLKYRGPVNTQVEDFSGKGWMGFHRLKIVDITDDGNQPMNHQNIHLMCNGYIITRNFTGNTRTLMPFNRKAIAR